MENNKKFRNHISLVAEQTGAVLGAVFIFAVTSLLDEIRALSGGTGALQDKRVILITLAGVLALILILVAAQLLVWAKTYISVYDGSIIIERNTVNRKKNTIGIKNISNVNTEQNLFEMLVGTCKVKLDTNTLSTANSTDVKIVLKKKDAEEFRRYIMSLMQKEAGNADGACGNEETGTEAEREVFLADVFPADVKADLADIMSHGVFSINALSILVLLGSVVGIVTAVAESAESGAGILGTLFSMILVIVVLVSALWDIMKDFIRYFGFQIARRGDKLYIRYGLLKRVDYTIPVDKINGLKLKQTMLARMMKRSMAEIINIGMGDEGTESESFLLPYCKMEEMQRRIGLILPEFQEAVRETVKRQPASVWAAWIFPAFVYTVIAGAGTAVFLHYFPQHQSWLVPAVLGLTAVILVLAASSYLTAGVALGEAYMVTASGYFGKRYNYIAYDKIQYVEFKQNFLAARMGILKGEIKLLASAADTTKTIPYCGEESAEKIKEKLLRRKGA